VKDTIIAALNAAGISGAAAMTDAQLLDAYNALQSQAGAGEADRRQQQAGRIEIAANAAADAELTGLATELATNSKGLTAADFKAMGLDALQGAEGRDHHGRTCAVGQFLDDHEARG
jgi:hypothetical protein